ncbi:GNAT family N-acetyltransferase [Streptomyces sp. NPDC093228]|uniref:GNAT family N-acetyltransferase n=1 Tax=unclassified Streptomyces TaxID=2593676 RepID=UPI000E25C875|nr:GNAT family N-acetyltransferase [Streptomyces sp. 3212.3]REE61945.1 penicillin amidase [Streptomyces sp. 3212.3]
MPTEIYRDAWGIPHLRADDTTALARLQGRVTALDRAWQLEVERHRAQGTSASFLGTPALAWDTLARRARLDDTARRCFAALERHDPETARWVRAYTDGVNEGLAEGARRTPEFGTTGLVPGRWEPWHPLGVWLGTHILFAGFPAKLWREEAARCLGEEAIGLFATDGPGTSGSNGWLVTGEHTVTGRAIVAGDPHRFIEDPGVYQQIHLACPEFDVVGLAVPGIPGIAHFGHTGPVAWAITNAMADYQDLYRERLRRTADGGVEALDPDGTWRAAVRLVQTVEVAGGDPVEVEVIETGRGPVVVGGPESAGTGTRPQAAVSLRHPPRVTERLGFGALLPLLRARRVADVDRALDLWAEPVNVVLAADVDGGVLHRVAGVVPWRGGKGRSRLVPAWEPGHEWRGWHDMPRGDVENGIAVMANQRGPAAPLGVEFAPGHRADRIRELLERKPRWSAGEMPAVHMDTRLASAAPLLDRLRALDGLTPGAGALRDVLLAWDRHMDADSGAAAVYAAVRGAVVRRLAAHPAFAELAAAPSPYPEVFLPWLALLPRIGFALEHLLAAEDLYGVDRAAIVREAVEEVAVNPPRGTWGDTHRLAPWRATPGTPYEEPGLSGDHDCVLCTSCVPGLTDLSARGPAARYVWDLARRDDSLWVVPLGALGVPGSPHHRDQLPLWLEGELVPVVTDWDRLTKEAPTAAEPYAAHREAVHEELVEGFGAVRIVPLDPRADLDVVHGWVSEERASFWDMTGLTKEQVGEIYAHMATLDTHHAFLAVKDGEPVALLQTYEPEADRVGACYAVEPGDIGAHLLLAPPGSTGARAGWTSALLTAFTSYILDGLGRRRVVVDPDERNEKAIARFLRQGFVPGPAVVLPEVDLPDVHLPEKRARLAFLTRPVRP